MAEELLEILQSCKPNKELEDEWEWKRNHAR